MAFSDPETNIQQFMLGEGMRVADLGCGTGAYTLAAAKAVKASGRVYAVEVQQDLLTRLQNTATLEGLNNIEYLWGDVETEGGTKIQPHTLDAVIGANLLFQLEDKPGFVKEIKRILKPGGKVLIVDWQESFGGMGPQPDMVVNNMKARELFEQGGFGFVQDITAGEHHYGMVLKVAG